MVAPLGVSSAHGFSTTTEPILNSPALAWPLVRRRAMATLTSDFVSMLVLRSWRFWVQFVAAGNFASLRRARQQDLVLKGFLLEVVDQDVDPQGPAAGQRNAQIFDAPIGIAGIR